MLRNNSEQSGESRKKVLSLERKCEWVMVMEYQITVSMTVGR